MTAAPRPWRAVGMGDQRLPFVLGRIEGLDVGMGAAAMFAAEDEYLPAESGRDDAAAHGRDR